jgi:hypothetical protein
VQGLDWHPALDGVSMTHDALAGLCQTFLMYGRARNYRVVAIYASFVTDLVASTVKSCKGNPGE